jgi:hypothetical protein
MTPSEIKQERLETLAIMYDIVAIAIAGYKKRPTAETEKMIREIKLNADLYKKQHNL